MGWNIDRFMDKTSVIDNLICAICTDVLENPVLTPCQHSFCNDCIRVWLKDGKQTCPVDRQKVTIKELQPSTILQQLLNKFIVRCKHFDEGCCLMTTFEEMPQLIEHELNQCRVIRYDAFHKEYENNVKDGADKKKTIAEQARLIEHLEEQLQDQKELQQEQSTINRDSIEDLHDIISEKDKVIEDLGKKITSLEETIEEHKKVGQTIADQAKMIIGKSLEIPSETTAAEPLTANTNPFLCPKASDTTRFPIRVDNPRSSFDKEKRPDIAQEYQIINRIKESDSEETSIYDTKAKPTKLTTNIHVLQPRGEDKRDGYIHEEGYIARSSSKPASSTFHFGSSKPLITPPVSAGSSSSPRLPFSVFPSTAMQRNLAQTRNTHNHSDMITLVPDHDEKSDPNYHDVNSCATQ